MALFNGETMQTKEELIERIKILEEELGLLWSNEVRCCDCNAKLDIELENREIITIEEVTQDVVEPEG